MKNMGSYIVLALLFLSCQDRQEQSGSDYVGRKLTYLAGDENYPRFSPDGRQILFHSNQDGNWDIFTKSLDDTAITQLTFATANDQYADWSPDGRAIVFQSDREGESGIWIKSLSGTAKEALRLRNQPSDCHFPAWAPDARSIAVSRIHAGKSCLWLIPTDGGEPRQLTFIGNEYFPKWSPDGTRLTYYAGHGDSIKTVHVASGRIENISNAKFVGWRPTFSPDGNQIAFISAMRGSWDVWTCQSDGSALTQLTEGTSREDFPTWSPDGKTVAFSRLIERSQVYRVAVNTGSITQLTSGGDNFNPVGSPKAVGEFAFIAQLTGPPVVRLYEAKREITLGRDHTYINFLAWSPNGESIAYAGDSQWGEAPKIDVFLTFVDTDSTAQLTQDGDIRSPVWCGDASIVFSTHTGSSYAKRELWKFDVAEGDLTQLTDSNGDKYASDCSGTGQVVYTSRESTKSRRLFTIASAGGAATEIRTAFNYIESAHWSPDEEKLIVLARDVTQNQLDLYLLTVSDPKEYIRLTDTRQAESWPSWSADGLYVFYSINLEDKNIWARRIQ